jgi:hypothetical protein
MKKTRVDEINETLHNLASSLTDKTIRSMQYKIFKKLQSINVGV